MKVNLTEWQLLTLCGSLRTELELGKYEVFDYEKKLRILKKLEKAYDEQCTKKH
jgi:hypothetical protein|tara:strand:- start:514 stop:675 length:162 start_codon:yes stop_codon:yes gene_type:complete